MAAQTVAQILDALNDYADFEEVASVSRAKSFITAAKRWLAIVPGSSNNEASSMTMNPAQVESLLNRAQAYVTENDTSATGSYGTVRFLSSTSGGFR